MTACRGDADPDSTPDNVNDEAGDDPLDPSDDVVKDNVTAEDGQTNPADDEDDHDVATVEVPVFDLALIKTVGSVSDSPIIPGVSMVTFDIVVYNQGDMAATDITIVDYIEAGDYVYDSATNAGAGWSADPNAPTIEIAGPLAVGEAVTRSITLLVDAGASGQQLENYAEIVSALDENGASHVDIDSTPDSTNDEPGAGPVKDNLTVEDAKTNPGTEDEDDHDIALLTAGVFDLALRKSVASVSDTPLLPSGLVTFTIEVFNQGDIAVSNVEVVDYIQGGFEYDPSLNLNWTQSATNAPTTTVAGPLLAGQSTTVDIVLRVATGTAGQELLNYAEIAEDGVSTDQDSQPENEENDTNGDALTDDELFNNNGDEDDHDVASIAVSEAVAVGNYVWLDTNVDGTQDGGEPGLDNVTVELFHTLDGGATLTTAVDIDGVTVPSQQTTGGGFYSFTNLPPGEYVVRVIPPAGYALTIGGDDPDNNDNTDSNGIALAGQPYVQSLPVLLGVDEEPTDDDDSSADNDNSNLSVDFGFYQPVSIGDFVWFDQNADGIQDGSEPGLAGALVELFAADGVTPVSDGFGNQVAAQTTGASGAYSFTNLLPGDYVVQVTPPTGYELSPNDASGDDANDSDGTQNGSVVVSPVTTLTVGGETGDGDADDNNDPTVDFGFYQPVSVGDFVWHDENANGTQDDGEAPIAGAIVELFELGDGGLQPVIDIDGNFVEPQLTGLEGLYLFDNLVPGEYMVRVIPPAGYLPTTSGGDPDNDNNDDSNGEPVGGQPYVQSQPVTLVAATEPVNEDEDSNSNLSVDFGFVAFDLAVRKTVASVSDTPLIPNASTVTFNIEVINQGEVDAANIRLRDYFTTSMFAAFDAGLNPDGTTAGGAALGYTWSGTADGADVTLAGVLPAGQTAILPVTLRVADGTLGQSLANYVEVLTADDTLGNSPAVDVDSTPETVENNSDAATPGDPLVDNEVNDGGDTDEDDHDVATIAVDRFDLALVKRLSDQSETPINPGTTELTFTIEVFNQGDQTATEPIQIVDYLDTAAFTLVSTNWDTTDPTKPTLVIDDDIPAGGSVSREIVVRVNAGTYGQTLYNFAEIASDGMPDDADPDSTPDTDNDEAVDPTDPTDDNVKPGETAEDGQNNPADDEDDHDIEAIEVPVFDLALVKTVASTSDTPLVPGASTVTFDITVYNQGDVAARNIEVVDYIISGDYEYDPALNPDWTQAVTNAPTTTIAGPLVITDSITVQLVLRVAAGSANTQLENYAEIVTAEDANGHTPVDQDSTPDSNNNEPNDGPVKDNFTDEDAIAAPGVDDEDDHDIAVLSAGLFDLALVKRVDSVSSTPLIPGRVVTFTIEVYNQGDITATAPIALVDYVQNGFTFDGGLNAGWDGADPNNPRFTLNSDIGPGGSTIVDIALRVNTGTAGQTLYNFAEIVDDGVEDDRDSTPDSVNGEAADPLNPDDDSVKDDVTLEDGRNVPGEDEDDHDVASVDISEPVAVGDYVWIDGNVDGVQDGGESPLADALVELFVTTNSGITLTPAVDIDGSPVASQTTGGDGRYSFANLVPGDYVVRVTPPAGYALTLGGSDPDDDDNTDSNGYLVAGESYVQSLPVTLGVDEEPVDDNDGSADNDNSNLSVDFGFFQPVSLGNYVWFDADGDGQQDDPAGEPGIAGAQVALFAGDGVTPATDADGVPVAAQTTGADGVYNFVNLLPGDYVVQVTPPAGYVPTVGGADPNDNNNADSNGVAIVGESFVKSLPVALTVGGESADGDADDNNNDSVDFGFIQPVSVGNFVWFDDNADGQQGADEAGVPGVTVALFRTFDGGASLIPATDVDGNTVVSQTTDVSGFYSFGNLPPGDYVVRTTPPAGYGPTPVNVADPDDNNNVDSNIDTGRGTPSGAYESGVVTLVAQDEPVDDGDVDANSNLSVDFGYVVFDLALRKVVESTSSEPLIPGASTVTFKIQVLNQGNLTARNVRIVDYVQPGFTFDTGANAGWDGADPVNPVYTIPGDIAPGQTVEAFITLVVNADVALETVLENYAEIQSADDTLGNSPAIDFDSQPEIAEGDTNGDPLVDNEIADAGDTDEDDHDIAIIAVERFDLALVKRFTSQSDTPLVPGTSTVAFTIEVFNQGDVTLNQPVTIVDYVPAGFTFDGADNPGWDGADVAKPTYVLNEAVAPGRSTTVDIVLRLDADTYGQTIENVAEIANDGQPGDADPDSTPDVDSTNDGVVKPGETAEDGQSNPGSDDEDDHDIASIRVPVFDLALIKTVASLSDTPLIPGVSTVVFEIEVFNQGEIAADNVTIVDYVIPGDFVYDPALNPDWSADSNPTITIVGPIAPRQSAVRTIVLRVASDTAGRVLENFAEIVSATDANGAPQVDIDSTPDAENTESAVKDNFTFENARSNPGTDDEDDHDVATVAADRFDLALNKRLVSHSTAPLLPGSTVVFEIEVFNQGDTPATDVTVVDYVQSGDFSYDATANAGWSDDPNPTYTFSTPILPGQSATVQIELTVNTGTAGRTVRNFAEIAEDGINVDADSVPENEQGNQNADPVVDNELYNNGGDEDDHDVAEVTVATPVSLGNYVWIDSNLNGVQDGDEAPLP